MTLRLERGSALIATLSYSQQAPAVTTFASELGGHKKGDVLMTLPKELAGYIENFTEDYSRSPDCKAGTSLNSNFQKRVDDVGVALCAARGVIINAVPGGALADLRVLQSQPLPFIGVDVVRALNAAMDFARQNAAMLRLDSVQAARLGAGQMG